MSDKLVIDRELLEDLRDCASECVLMEKYNDRRRNRYWETSRKAGEALAAPQQEPVGEEVEVVMWVHPAGDIEWNHKPWMGPEWQPVMTVARCQRIVAGLKAEIAELREAAMRYQWLRERGDTYQWENILRFDLDEGDYPTIALALDAAIDAALDAPKPCPHGCTDGACKQCYAAAVADADGIDDSMELKGGPWDTGALGRDPDHAVVAEGSREEVAEALSMEKPE